MKKRVGGVTDVGFAEDDSLLLVVSHNGRGVFDSVTGACLARDPLNDWSYLDDQSGRVEGIGPLAGQHVPVAGLMSRRAMTADNGRGWMLSGDDEGVDVTGASGERQRVSQTGLEIRAFGFGSTGEVWVLATTASIDFYRRSV